MKLTIDTETATVTGDDGSELPLYSPEAFARLSHLWVKCGWQLKYTYTFSWFGRPIIQLPEDMVRVQEIVYRVRPDVVVETGVAHGGSLVFYASLLKAMGRGRVIGVDIEIRPHNRKAIEAHELSAMITLVEGDSVSASTLSRVRSQIRESDRVLVLLDSNHSKAHVHRELEAYAPLVSPGSYIVATDGVTQWVSDVPRGNPHWTWDNPSAAAKEFGLAHPEFVLEDPPAIPFDESSSIEPVTHWPSAYLRRQA
jgi:cephalosporin hydroxylase